MSAATGGIASRAEEYADARMLLLAACGATFLAYLDVTIVTIVFPQLSSSFSGASVADVSWVLSAYAVTEAALLAPGGRFSDVIGHRKFFVLGVALFVASSLVAALAPTLLVLILARAVQGCAAAAMIPAALGLILTGVPPEKRTAAIGLWGAVSSLAAVLGPSIGGLLVEAGSWRWVFLVNVPLGIGLIVLAQRKVRARLPIATTAPDGFGSVLMVISIGALVLALTKINDWGWNDPRVLGAFAAGAVGAILAIQRSRAVANPALELSLWRSRQFAIVSGTALIFGATSFAWMVIGPLFLNVVWGYSIINAALAITPGAVAAAIAAIVIGSRGGPAALRKGIIVGGIALAAATGAQALLLTEQSTYLALWLPVSLVGGFGMGLTLTGLASATANALTPAAYGTGNGLVAASRQLGGAIGIAATAAILSASQLDLDAFHAAFGFCAVVALVASGVGLGLVASARDAIADPATATAD